MSVPTSSSSPRQSAPDNHLQIFDMFHQNRDMGVVLRNGKTAQEVESQQTKKLARIIADNFKNVLGTSEGKVLEIANKKKR